MAMRSRRFLRDEGGSVLVEFAMALPLFIAILIAIVEMATFFWTRNTLQFAAEEGARTALVSASATTSAVKAAVVAKLDGTFMDTSNVTVTAVQDTYSGVSFMKVTATYAWPSTGITGLLPVDFGSISGQARVPMVP